MMEYLIDGKTEAQWRRVAEALQRIGDKIGAEKAMEKANERQDALQGRLCESTKKVVTL